MGKEIANYFCNMKYCKENTNIKKENEIFDTKGSINCEKQCKIVV